MRCCVNKKKVDVPLPQKGTKCTKRRQRWETLHTARCAGRSRMSRGGNIVQKYVCPLQNIRRKILLAKYYAENANKEIRLWMEEKKRHCALKMMASALLASGTLADAKTKLQI